MCIYDDFDNDDSSSSDKGESCGCDSCGSCCRSQCDHRCGRFFANYRGPLIVIAVGFGFMAVGAIPAAVAAATHAKNSALIIGAGFIGFGLLIFLPGLFWCIIQKLMTCACCVYCCSRRKHVNGRTPPVMCDEEEECGSTGSAARYSGLNSSENMERHLPSLNDIQRDSLLAAQDSIHVEGVHDNDHCNHHDDDDDDDHGGINHGSDDVIITVATDSSTKDEEVPIRT